jgi:hypothetical protein
VADDDEHNQDEGVQVVAREFDEKEDADYVRMRIVAIWEAQEAMERGLEEREHPSLYFA